MEVSSFVRRILPDWPARERRKIAVFIAAETDLHHKGKVQL
jgi:hypothetical protein